MRRFALGLGAGSAICALLLSAFADAATFATRLYQTPAGAMTVHAGGDFVDPYFAIKALQAADLVGLETRPSARAWIGWLMPRQRADGRFDRYCRSNGEWRACEPADADDALLALWIELLYRLSPEGGLPPAWQESVRRAESHLESLYDDSTGLYRVARAYPTALFIDNVEVQAALAFVAKRRWALGERWSAVRTGLRAWRLRRAIERAFWSAERERFAVAVATEWDDSFYPEAVAQIYPWLHGLAMPAGRPGPGFERWLAAHGEEWLSLASDPYPWGLVALTAVRVGNDPPARQWVVRAAPLRHGPRWNVLEEAVYQGLHRMFFVADERAGA